MVKKKATKPEKPREQMTEQERIEDWRQRRALRGTLEKPKVAKKESK